MLRMQETCEGAMSFGDAFIAGVAHTDIGLTIATIVLAGCTFLLIDDNRMNRIHERFTHVAHPFRNVHAAKDQDITGADGSFTHTHTELSLEEGEK